MKETIIATDKVHLKQLIKKEIELNGNQCDLNHINVSKVKSMDSMFSYSPFNGDISQWDIRKIETINEIFNGIKNTNIPYWAKLETQEERILVYNKYLLLNH